MPEFDTRAQGCRLAASVSGVEPISRESIYSEREENGALAAELLALGRNCAARLKEPWRGADHAELLYAELLYNARESPR
jgi:hypothetical protein